jgi:hypothetical protein
MKLTELQKQIFEINKANGWHDKVPSKLEQHALFHTEITEAYNEFIAGRLETWYQEDGKPEGFYTELADVVIRILDYMSLEKTEYTFFEGEPVTEYGISTELLLLSFHSFISRATEDVRNSGRSSEVIELCVLIKGISDLLASYNQSLTDLIIEKIAYNKTRGYRYGGKVI